MEPVIKDIAPMHLVGCGEVVNIENNDFAGIEVAWDKFFNLKPMAIANTLDCDRFWGVCNMAGNTQTYIAAKEVTEPDVDHAFYAGHEVSWLKHAVFTYHGNPKYMGPAFCEAFKWVENSTYELADSYTLELYDARCNPEDMDNYTVDIYIPVK